MHTIKQKKIGLALGSGGVRGFAHIGVLNVLISEKIPIDFLAGSSAGAIVAAYFAVHNEIENLENLALKMKKIKFVSLIDFISPKKALIRGKKIQKFLNNLVLHFGDDWWEEPLRFFIGESNAEKFDNFMGALFSSAVTDELDQKAQNLLQTMVKDAPAKKMDTFVAFLKNKKFNENKKRYILECLKTIGTKEANKHIKDYAQAIDNVGANLDYAEELRREAEAPEIVTAEPVSIDIFKSLPKSFRNPMEENAEYILIPGGSYDFKIENKTERVKVPNTYFAKYPVTHKRYKSFIDYLQGKNSQAAEILKLDNFTKELKTFAQNIKGFTEYLKEKPTELYAKIES